jgi:fatty acid/phospholipid biosynthesis enzyme
MKAHGSARERAIMNAVRVTKETIQHHISHLIRQEIARANERLADAKVTPSLVPA